MKLLHTADWHVGRRIRDRSRLAEHEAVLGEIVALAGEHAVDLVLVTGDQFDQSAPPPEAERLVYRTLRELVDLGAHVVVVAGNHDNAQRLAALRPFTELTSITTGAHLARPDEGGVVEVVTRSGEKARIALFPFQSQRGIVKASDLMTKDADEHAQDYAERCTRVLKALCEGFAPDAVNVVAVHAGVLGAQTGGGERAAHVSGDYLIPATAFPISAHYVALGHFHRAQAVPGPCPIWYAGAPLQLDFSDTETTKHALLVEAKPGKPARVTSLPLSSGRKLRTVTGTLKELTRLGGTLGDDYLRVDVREAPRSGLADEVRELFPNAVEVRVVHEREEEDPAPGLDALQGSPVELFEAYLAEEGVEDPAMVALFKELVDAELDAGGVPT